MINKMNVQLEPEDSINVTDIVSFYDNIAKTLGLDKDAVRYDCTKIDVSRNIQKNIFNAWERMGASDIEIGMTWCNSGPKTDDNLPRGTIRITHGFVMNENNEPLSFDDFSELDIVTEKQYIPDMPTFGTKELNDLGFGYDKDEWYRTDTDNANENLSNDNEKAVQKSFSQSGETIPPECPPFDHMVKLAAGNMNVAIYALKSGDVELWQKMKHDAELILNTINVFTGRNIEIEYDSSDITAYSLVGNKYSDNGKTIYSFELLENGEKEKYYIPDAPSFGTKELNDLGCEYDEDKDQWFNADFGKALDAAASLRERAQSREAEIAPSTSKKFACEMN